MALTVSSDFLDDLARRRAQADALRQVMQAASGEAIHGLEGAQEQDNKQREALRLEQAQADQEKRDAEAVTQNRTENSIRLRQLDEALAQNKTVNEREALRTTAEQQQAARAQSDFEDKKRQEEIDREIEGTIANPAPQPISPPMQAAFEKVGGAPAQDPNGPEAIAAHLAANPAAHGVGATEVAGRLAALRLSQEHARTAIDEPKAQLAEKAREANQENALGYARTSAAEREAALRAAAEKEKGAGAEKKASDNAVEALQAKKTSIEIADNLMKTLADPSVSLTRMHAYMAASRAANEAHGFVGGLLPNAAVQTVAKPTPLEQGIVSDINQLRERASSAGSGSKRVTPHSGLEIADGMISGINTGDPANALAALKKYRDTLAQDLAESEKAQPAAGAMVGAPAGDAAAAPMRPNPF